MRTTANPPALPEEASGRKNASWFEQLLSEVNSDPEMDLKGGNLTATVSFTFGSDRHDLVFQRGKVVDLRHGKKIDWRCDFGFRASDETWDKFFADPPPPLYNSVFAMIMRVPDFQLEGDSMVLAQNARAVTRLLDIMQEQGRL